MTLEPATGPASPEFYLGLAGASALIGLAGIPLLVWLVEHAHLPLWAHIPLTLLALHAIALGGLGAGVAFSAYRLRRQMDGPGN